MAVSTKFTYIRWKNFLSTGDKFTEIDITASAATLITGTNGAGKSTLLDALAFGLFGKPYRSINKPQLTNSINGKRCVVEVEFQTGPDSYLVRRGLVPAIFEIHKNGTMLPQSATVREYQQFLEQNVLKMNYKTFHQVVVLGSSDYTPFMQLTAASRRSVIEDLLDINVFTRMNVVLKEDSARLKDDARDIATSIAMLGQQASIQTGHIAQLESINDGMVAEKQNLIASEQSKGQILAEKIVDARAKVASEMDTYQSRRAALDAKMAEISGHIAYTKTGQKQTDKKIAFFEDNPACPTCTQDIPIDLRESSLKELHFDHGQHDIDLQNYLHDQKHLQDDMTDLASTLTAIRVEDKEISDWQADMQTCMSMIKSLQADITGLSKSGAEVTAAKAELAAVEADLVQFRHKRAEIDHDMTYHSVMAEMLKDGGIKTKIIRQYLPVMNKLINDYLQILDFFVLFQLDDSFSETILSRHRDNFSYASFSMGERQRIDLSILFAWRQVARMKNSVSTNLLILDETFDASLDPDGVDNLMKIMHSLEDGTNAFVISHKGHLLAEKFEAGLKFDKVNNFSVMKEN